MIFAYGYGGYGLGVFNNGQLVLTRVDVDGVFSASVIADLNWHHVAVTKSGSTTRFYVDGAPASPALAYTTTYTFDTSAAIGSRGDARGGTFFGMVDEPSVYSRALSAAELQAIYNAGIGGKCPLPPVMVAQPTNATVVIGSAATFNALVSGSPPLGYQWFFNGTPLTNGGNGANTTALSIPNAQPGDAGNYWLIASNALGAATSSVVTLTVQLQPPGITQSPQNQFKYPGSNVFFSVTASGTPPLSYQWFFNGASLADDGRITGSLTNVLGIASVQTNDAGSYQVVASNPAGSATSAVATLTVLVPPAILAHPTNQTVLLNSNATFTVTATGNSPLSYRWRHGGVDLSDNGRVSDATNSTLAIAGAQTTDAGDYTVVVTNLAGGTTSAVAVLTVVVVPPTITTQPASRTNVVGTLASFSATADGSAPLKYQWQSNGTNIAGATNTSLALTKVQLSDAGEYSLVVTNIGGSVTSSPAVLTVVLPVCLSSPSNLVSWWPGEGVTTDTMARNNGTNTGTGTFGYGPGVAGQAFVFEVG